MTELENAYTETIRQQSFEIMELRKRINELEQFLTLTPAEQAVHDLIRTNGKRLTQYAELESMLKNHTGRNASRDLINKYVSNIRRKRSDAGIISIRSEGYKHA